MENKFFVGTTYTITEELNDQITEQDLLNDPMLKIVEGYTIFTTEEYLKDVKEKYSIEEVMTLSEWAMEDANECYHNYVQDEIKYHQFAERDEVNGLFADTLQNMSDEELRNCNMIETYVKCAKQVIILSLKMAALEIEKELA